MANRHLAPRRNFCYSSIHRQFTFWHQGEDEMAKGMDKGKGKDRDKMKKKKDKKDEKKGKTTL